MLNDTIEKNEWIFNYRIVNSSNLCIISIFQGWKISMDWKDGTFFFYLYIIISVTHRIVKFLSLLNFTYLDYVFPLFLSLSLFVLLEKRVSIFLFLRSIFLLILSFLNVIFCSFFALKCKCSFFLWRHMFLNYQKDVKKKGYNIWNTM